MKHQKDPSRKIRVILRVVLIALFAVLSLAVLQPKAEAVPICKHLNSTWQTTRVPTCTQTGLKQKICTKCGAVVQTQTISAYGHDYYVERQNATCTTDGWIRTKCARCNLVSNYTTLSALGHSLTSTWTTSNSPTCVTAGTEYQKCQRCKKNVTRSIDPLGHQLSWVTTTPATCTSRGTESQKCSRCGTVVSTRSIPMKKHTNPDGYVIEVPATCTSDGKKVLRCKDCNTILDTLVIPKYGHDCYVQRQNATCTTDGWEETICTRCGCTVASTVRPALGHNPSDWVITTPATCASDGKMVLRCKDCQTVLDEMIIERTGQHFVTNQWHWILHPTCTAEGSQYQECQTCGEIVTRTVDPLEHEYNIAGFCSRCGTMNNQIYHDRVDKIEELVDKLKDNDYVTPNNAYMDDGELSIIWFGDDAFYFDEDFMLFGSDPVVIRSMNPLLSGTGGRTFQYMITPTIVPGAPGMEPTYYWDIAKVEIATVYDTHTKDSITVSFALNDEIRLAYYPGLEMIAIQESCHTISPEIEIGFSETCDKYIGSVTETWEENEDMNTRNHAASKIVVNGAMAAIQAYSGDYIGAGSSVYSCAQEAWNAIACSGEYYDSTQEVRFYRENDGDGIDPYGVYNVALMAQDTDGQSLSHIGDHASWTFMITGGDSDSVEDNIYLNWSLDSFVPFIP